MAIGQRLYGVTDARELTVKVLSDLRVPDARKAQWSINENNNGVGDIYYSAYLLAYGRPSIR